MFKSILVPVDGSANSKKALEYAINLARQCYLGKISIIHVIPPATAIVTGPELLVVDVDRQLEESGKSILASAAETVKKAGLESSTHLTHGRPGERIIEVAEKEGVDIIVIGSRGLSSVKRLFLGSVSDYVSHNAPCPVMIVR